MKAVRYHKFGEPDVLQVEEIDDLVINEDQLLVEVFSTSVNSGDCHLRSGKPFLARLFAGPFTPKQKILGTTYSGKVVEVGKSVKQFKVGDEVMGSLGIHSGTYVEYIGVHEDSVIAIKPTKLSHEEAASLIFGSLSAKYFLDQAGLDREKKVLIIGASGGVGAYAVQYARNLNAHTTGVCHQNSMGFVKKLGADQVVDYQSNKLSDFKNQFDIIFDTVGREKLSVIEACLTKEGTYITTAARADLMLKQIGNKPNHKRFMFGIAKSNASSLINILDLVQHGAYEPLIDSIFPMRDVVSAHRRAEESGKTGAIVLNIKG